MFLFVVYTLTMILMHNPEMISHIKFISDSVTRMIWYITDSFASGNISVSCTEKVIWFPNTIHLFSITWKLKITIDFPLLFSMEKANMEIMNKSVELHQFFDSRYFFLGGESMYSSQIQRQDTVRNLYMTVVFLPHTITTSCYPQHFKCNSHTKIPLLHHSNQ